MKHLRLRRSDTCAVCSRALEPGTGAWWDATARTVTCEDCHAVPTPPEIVPTDERLERGKAGASAAREHERRRERREQRTHERHRALEAFSCCSATHRSTRPHGSEARPANAP
jgi:hypothetical protein